MCGFVAFADGGWVVVDPQGRFDTDNLDEIRGAHWVAPAAPVKGRAYLVSVGVNVAPAALKARQPALFDFARKRRTTVLTKTQ